MLDLQQQPTHQNRRGELVCPLCQQSEWTWLRLWYLGHDAVWFCDFCYEMIPHLRAVP